MLKRQAEARLRLKCFLSIPIIIYQNFFGWKFLLYVCQFIVIVSLAHFPVSKKRTTAHLRTPFHYFQLTNRALTVPLLLPDSEKFPMAVWSPYYSFVVLSGSTAIGWLHQEYTMSSKHLWGGPFTSTFCENCDEVSRAAPSYVQLRTILASSH